MIVIFVLIPKNMMTSSNGNIFRVTGLLCGELIVLSLMQNTSKYMHMNWGLNESNLGSDSFNYSNYK